MKRVTIFGEAEDRTVAQLERCLDPEEGAVGVLCADNHLGYSQPIGGAVAYREHISPSGVGYDIGCGNKAVRTNLMVVDLHGEQGSALPGLMDNIFRRISFGLGRKNNEPVDHEVLDAIREASFEPQREMLDLAARQLGTVGTGNHYVDLFADEEQRIWVGVHFGSRGFGWHTANGFLAIAQGLPFSVKERKQQGLKVSEGEMESPPVLFTTGSTEGQAYIEAMKLAGAYAYAGRDLVVAKVLEILGAEAQEEVHNHHNFAWREEHGGEQFWVVRKGCTPAFPGQTGFVGATMGEDAVILEGTRSAESALFSTVHGAGRVMSRTKAAGKVKRRKFWECNVRDCSYRHTDKNQFACPDHPDSKPMKRFYAERVSEGAIDWEATQAEVRAKGIELRGGAADEAPGAYKRLSEVLAAHANTVKVLHRLRPLGVAMAPADVADPFKD